MTNFFCIRYRPHLPEVRGGKGFVFSPHGALTCLYGVTYSWASPRLFLGVTSSVSGTDRTSPRCEGEGWYPVTAWRTTCLYGVSYSRASTRLFLGVVFVSNHLRVAHYLLIRCYYSRITPTFPDGVTSSVSEQSAYAQLALMYKKIAAYPMRSTPQDSKQFYLWNWILFQIIFEVVSKCFVFRVNFKEFSEIETGIFIVTKT